MGLLGIMVVSRITTHCPRISLDDERDGPWNPGHLSVEASLAILLYASPPYPCRLLDYGRLCWTLWTKSNWKQEGVQGI